MEGETVHEVLQLLMDSHYQLQLTVQLPNDYCSSDDDTYSKFLLMSDVTRSYGIFS